MNICLKILIYIFLFSILINYNQVIAAGVCGITDANGDQVSCSDLDNWDHIKTEDLQNNKDAAEFALREDKLTPEQKEDFFSDPNTNLNEYEEYFKKYANEKYKTNLQEIAEGTEYTDGKLIYEGSDVKLSDFEGSDISTKDGKLIIDGKEFKNGQNIQSTEDGEGIQADFVEAYSDGVVSIVNGVNVKIYENKITASHADSFIRDNSVSANVDNLESIPEVFSVEKADFVMSGCVRADNVIDSTFRIDDSSLEVIAGEGILVNITDCNSNNVGFNSDGGTITVTKDTPPQYTITKGNLTFNSARFSEKIATNNTAIATLELNEGFSCMTLFPISTYYYFDENIQKDYAVHIPEHSDEYRLCIRKDQIQHFTDYDGIVDMPVLNYC